jgi:hypothetical protein
MTVDNTRLTMWAQIALAFLLVGGTLAVLIILLMRHIEITQQALTLITSILGSLVAMAAAAVAYFFARHRPATSDPTLMPVDTVTTTTNSLPGQLQLSPTPQPPAPAAAPAPSNPAAPAP